MCFRTQSIQTHASWLDLLTLAERRHCLCYGLTSDLPPCWCPDVYARYYFIQRPYLSQPKIGLATPEIPTPTLLRPIDSQVRKSVLAGPSAGLESKALEHNTESSFSCLEAAAASMPDPGIGSEFHSSLTSRKLVAEARKSLSLRTFCRGFGRLSPPTQNRRRSVTILQQYRRRVTFGLKAKGPLRGLRNVVARVPIRRRRAPSRGD